MAKRRLNLLPGDLFNRGVSWSRKTELGTCSGFAIFEKSEVGTSRETRCDEFLVRCIDVLRGTPISVRGTKVSGIASFISSSRGPVCMAADC